MKKVAIHNLGCKVNAYESDIICKKLTENGYMIVPFDQKADVYIVNTCSVTNIADRKTRQFLHRAKSMNPEALVVAAGCYVDTRGSERVLSDNVDIALVNREKEDIARVLNDYFREENPAVPEAEAEYVHTRKFIKCQDGCNMFCTYCIIPYARGRIESRKIKDVCDEIRILCRQGFREFVLTGIHISSYGLDRPDEKEDLLSLVRAVSEIEGVRRIRLGSLEPGIVSRDFASALSKIDKLCPHFHLSLQSGSNTVLKRMNRKYTTEGFLAGTGFLREAFDRPAITTDIITGFPGETEEEFNETVEFVKKIAFYETHIFKYSRRKGTAADRMEGQITEKVKAERSDVLLGLNKIQKRTFMDSHFDGKRKEVLIEEEVNINNERFLTGYTREYIRCAIPYSDKLKSGDIISGIFRDYINEDMVLLSDINVIE